MLLSTKSVRSRVALLIAAAVTSMIALAAALIADSRSRIADFHLENAKTAIAAALSMLEHDHMLVVSGVESQQDAQERALRRLRDFRYADGEGYVAIVEDDGFMTMHPIHPHLDQTNIWDLQDVEGTYITQQVIQTGKAQKIGVNRYYFEHPTTGQVDIKTSAVGRFEAWGWTLIVGVFEKSVNSAVNEMLSRAALVVATMSVIFLLLASAIGRSLSQPIAALTRAMTSVAEGRLETPIPFQENKNELGLMARALSIFRDSGRRIVELQAEKEAAHRAIESERIAMATRLRNQFGEVMEASSRGDFTKRVSTGLADKNLRALAETLNAFVSKVDAGVSTVKDAMSSMSEGRRPSVEPQAFEGAFADMLKHIDRTANIIQRQAKNLEHNAHHDSLTGLPNRRYFEGELSKFSTLPNADSATLLHIDLDRFKEINDTLGHAAGDEILKHTAQSLRDLTRPGDFIARIGGDEFVVLSQCDDAAEVATDIVMSLSSPHVVKSGVARFGASIGVARAATKDFSGDDLMRDADLALYEAKRKGRNQVRFFSPDMLEDFEQSKRLGDDIRRGLDNHEFIPFFQPQVDAKTRAIVGVEALARWAHPERGVLAPVHFLTTAEDIDVIAQIDAQVFEGALAAVARLNDGESTPIQKLAVNVSCDRLLSVDMLDAIDRAGPLTHRLAFELLESIVFDDQGERFHSQIAELKQRGIEIEIDDFGSGRASITGLLSVAPNRLKVDKQLVAPIAESKSQRRLIEAILEIGRALEIGIIAEGVETLAHADLLAEMQCETLQGFAFARPLAEGDLAELIREPKQLLAS